MKTARVDVEALRVLLDEATPGPWEPYVLGSEGYDVRAERPKTAGRLSRVRVARCGYEEWETDKANAALIAAAVNALPALLAELAASREALARVEALAEEWQENAAANERAGYFPWAMWQNRANDLRAALATPTERTGA